MVFINDVQRETLFLVDEMINEGKTFEEIEDYLLEHDYTLSVEVKNGYASKTHFRIEKIDKYKKDGKTHAKYEYTFVDLIKRRNGFAYWETIRLS